MACFLLGLCAAVTFSAFSLSFVVLFLVPLVEMHIAVLIYFMSNPYLIHAISEVYCFHAKGMFDVYVQMFLQKQNSYSVSDLKASSCGQGCVFF